MPNRAVGGALPGLSVAQDVSHFHEIASRMRTVDEARKQLAQEQAQAQAAAAQSATQP